MNEETPACPGSSCLDLGPEAKASKRNEAAECHYASAEAVEQLERLYATPEVVAQRQRTRMLLGLQVGQHVLDIGCGAGHLCFEMGGDVGQRGVVCGIDTSDAMVERTKAKCRCLQCKVDCRVASALSLPYADSIFDAVVSVQVLEYIPTGHILAALNEIARVLKPGGRAVLLDTDWTTRIVATEDSKRMQLVLEALSAHYGFADLHLPPKLPSLLQMSKLKLISMEGFPLLRTGSYEAGDYFDLPGTIPERGLDGIGADCLSSWASEFKARSERGIFFSSVTRFICVAGKETEQNSPLAQTTSEIRERNDVEDVPALTPWVAWTATTRTIAARSTGHRNSYRMVASFSTREGFVEVFKNLPGPCEWFAQAREWSKSGKSQTHSLDSRVDVVMIFREGVKPEWEDAANARGGHLHVDMKPLLTEATISEHWDTCVRSLVSDLLQPCSIITGVRLVDKLSGKGKVSDCIKLELWYHSDSAPADIQTLRRSLEKILCGQECEGLDKTSKGKTILRNHIKDKKHSQPQLLGNNTAQATTASTAGLAQGYQ